MRRIEIHIPDDVAEEIENTSKFLGIQAEELCTRILSSYTRIITHSPAYNSKLIIKNSIYDELKVMMDKYNISQNDLAGYLRISQAAISYAFSGKNNSKLKQTIDKMGLERFILSVVQDKFFKLGDSELYKNLDHYSFSNLSKWPRWRKIFFGYALEHFSETPIIIIFDIIDKLDEEVGSSIFNDMSIDVDTFLLNISNLLFEIYLTENIKLPSENI